jgi:hypothetical protein
MELYNEVERGSYPTPMTVNPRIWGNDFKTFLFPVFAVYFEKQNRFGLYRIRVAEAYHIIEPYKTDRTDPYYLDRISDPSEPPSEAYWVKSQFTFCIWFQGAWLCRKNGTVMSAVIPVMKLTNLNNNCKYTKYFSAPVFESPAALEWTRNYKTINKTMHFSIERIARPIPYSPVKPKLTISSIPTFVVNTLLEAAIQEKRECSITMEPITKETAAVTSCYHIFNRDAIAIWLASTTSCPVCKQDCTLSS